MRVAMTATVVALLLAAEVPVADAAGSPETVGGQLGALVETVTAPVLPELSPPTSAEASVPPVAAEPTPTPPTPDPAPGSTAAAPSPVAQPGKRPSAGVAVPLGGGDPAAPLAAADARPQPIAAAAHAGASGGKGRAHTATRREPRGASSGTPVDCTRLHAAAAGLPDRRPALRPGPGADRGRTSNPARRCRPSPSTPPWSRLWDRCGWPRDARSASAPTATAGSSD